MNTLGFISGNIEINMNLLNIVMLIDIVVMFVASYRNRNLIDKLKSRNVREKNRENKIFSVKDTYTRSPLN